MACGLKLSKELKSQIPNTPDELEFGVENVDES